MSVDYSVISGIGFLLDLSSLNLKSVVHSCDHQERIGNKYCPKCGKVVSSRKVDNNEISDALREFIYDEEDEGQGDFTIPKNYLVESIFNHENHYFIGFGVSVDPHEEEIEFFALPPVTQIEATVRHIYTELREHVEGLPAFDENKFGFYSISVAS